MSGSIVLLASLFLLVAAYALYGRWVAKKFGVDDTLLTPAHRLRDDGDYVPARAPVLLGHHFASIAGAAPIIGPISAAVFGWVPVLLWLLLGGIFFGAMHDFAALFVSVRNDGRSIGEVIKKHVGNRGSVLFLLFTWFTLALVIAAFTIIVAKTFSTVPAAASSSLMFILLAVVFGIALNRFNRFCQPVAGLDRIVEHHRLVFSHFPSATFVYNGSDGGNVSRYLFRPDKRHNR